MSQAQTGALEMNDVSKDIGGPCGAVVDPLLVSAFSLVQRYGPAICRTQQDRAVPEDEAEAALQKADEMRFLWRNIYPKLPPPAEGEQLPADKDRPCYNPAGEKRERWFVICIMHLIVVGYN